MAKKKVKKVRLDDLLNGKPSSGPDLYKGDEQKRKVHKKYRSPRDRMLVPKNSDYQRRLSGDPTKDILYHELAREFINNGFNQERAYRAVFGDDSKAGKRRPHQIFSSAWMKSLVLSMLHGEDGNDVPKEYAIEKWMQQIESNILDYMDDEGNWLSVRELRRLPRFAQEMIKKLSVTTVETPVYETNPDGNPLLDDRGARIQIGTVVQQNVHIELIDKQKALDSMARAMKWIEGQDTGDINIGVLMIEASKRMERMLENQDEEHAIEGEATRVASH